MPVNVILPKAEEKGLALEIEVDPIIAPTLIWVIAFRMKQVLLTGGKCQ